MLRCFNEPECHDVCHIEDTQVKVFFIYNNNNNYNFSSRTSL